MDPGSFFKKLLIFAALEANQITLPYNSADNFVIDSFKLEKCRYHERNRKFRNWHALGLTPSGCHLKTYNKALTKCSLPEAFIDGKAVSKSSKHLKTIFSC